MKSKQWYRIEKLQRKYSETNIVRGEKLSKDTIRRINKNYNKNQRKRRVDAILSEVKNKDSIKYEVHEIISELPTLKQLCTNCKEEMIITAIILYVIKSRKPRYHIDRTAIWNKYGLNWKKYSLIVSRLLQENRESKKLPYQYEIPE